MSDFVISTNKYSSVKTKKALIDGVSYNVRQLGAGDQLEMSELSRKIIKAKNKIDTIDDENEKVAIAEGLMSLTLSMERIYIRLFDDGTEDQEKSKMLVRKIGIDKVPLLLADIFDEEE